MGRHLIIGAGPAGLSAVDTIRELGDVSPITLVCDEPPYSRMVLPYFMDGTIPEANVYTADESYLESKQVDALFEKRVTSIESGHASLDDGSSVEFDAALVATGSNAVRPPIPGIEADGIFNLWTLDDSRKVLAARGGDLVVIGAGFIAFTCLDALITLADKVTVIEVEDRILPRMVDSFGAGLVRRWLEAKGVEFRVATTVQGIEERGGRKYLSVEGEEAVIADVVITATGIRPNLGLVQDSGIQTDFGIVADDHLRTSMPGVFAAGDVAQGPVVASQTREVHAIEPTALEQGRIAGANMAGADATYWGSLLMNIVAVQKLQIASFGRWEGDGLETRTVSNEERPVYRKLLFEEDRLVGAVFLGRPDDVAMLNDMGMVKGLIQTQVPLREWRKYLDDHPLDVRRPYVASRAAERLLEMRLLRKPSSPEGYRHPDPPPEYWPWHEVFVKTIPRDE
ncbi:MAG: NAD(P)/FAD-dependent oxidoreductase [Actinomycetota bacterium]